MKLSCRYFKKEGSCDSNGFNLCAGDSMMALAAQNARTGIDVRSVRIFFDVVLVIHLIQLAVFSGCCHIDVAIESVVYTVTDVILAYHIYPCIVR